MKKLLIVAGSKSDIPFLAESKRMLKKENINFKVVIVSAHRNIKNVVTALAPEKLQKQKIGVILAVAHSVANLPAVVAGYLKDAPIPVIGVGRVRKELDAIESLLSVISIPKGVPLLGTGIGEVGLHNATLAAVKILKLQR